MYEENRVATYRKGWCSENLLHEGTMGATLCEFSVRDLSKMSYGRDRSHAVATRNQA